MRLGPLVSGLLISIIYLMVSYIFNGVWKVDHAMKYCILGARVSAYNACAVLCLLYVNPLEKYRIIEASMYCM
jgi:hypothetical protein